MVKDTCLEAETQGFNAQNNKIVQKVNDNFGVKDKERLDAYSITEYCEDITNCGLETTWDKITYYTLHCNGNNPFLSIDRFGELYEIGLALANKEDKKNSGQYYTPEDVAAIMSTWLDKLEGETVCDVACGTGKLILTYLTLIGEERALQIISEGRLYLYDLDGVALNICKTILAKKYGDAVSKVHFIYCDFLDANIVLPKNCKVISNPPYATVDTLSPTWEKTLVAVDTKELYSMFMEKILKQSRSSVIITPYSFIGGNKFYSLRRLMNNHSGFIVSFDNVPGNIFCGRKHGIFNTNTSNSVRAAITVVENQDNVKGFRLTPLLRFKTDERAELLNCAALEGFIADKVQVVDEQNPAYEKCHKELQNIYDAWVGGSNKTLKDITSTTQTSYVLHVPNTCRYYTTASVRKLNRTGMMTLYVQDETNYKFLYCLINSSFAYWWWRIFDGGITYPIGLLNKMPVFSDRLSNEDKVFFDTIFHEMVAIENDCIITKLNAGAKQENIKFPSLYREKINERLVKILSCNDNYKSLNVLHQNNIFG